ARDRVAIAPASTARARPRAGSASGGGDLAGGPRSSGFGAIAWGAAPQARPSHYPRHRFLSSSFVARISGEAMPASAYPVLHPAAASCLTESGSKLPHSKYLPMQDDLASFLSRQTPRAEE